jgi:WD40 repeat protein
MGEEIETFGCQMPGPIRGPNNEGDFWGLTFGPDGKLYVCSSLFGPDRVLRFDPLTREPCPGPLGSLDSADFVPPDDNRNGGLRDGRGLTFGPDGNLYVSSGTDEVLRYHGVTGIFLDPFVSRRAGGMDDPTDLAFGPDGNLYVCCLRGGTGLSESQVLVFDGVTGCFLRALVRDDPGTPIDETGGLKEAWGIAFDAQDRVYLTSHLNNKVLRYDRVTGAVIDCFVQPNAGGLDRPFGLEFGPDGDLFVASNNTANSGFSDDFILRYDGQTGVFKNVHVELPGGTATYLKFRPPGLVTRPTLLVGLGENRVSRSASDPVSLCARFVNKPVPRRVLVFVWIEDPDRIVHPLALPQNFQICPERPQQGQIPPGAGPVVSGSLDFSTSFRIGTAGAGLLTEDGEYAVGARVVDAFTGVVHSSARVPFVVVP